MKTSVVVVLAVALASAAHAQQFDIKQKPLVLTEPKPIAPLLPGEDFVLHEGESVTMPAAPVAIQQRPGFWTFGSWDRAHPLRTNYEVFHDRAWIANRSDLPEYAIGTAFNVLVLKFLTKPLIFEWPAIAIGKHLQAGSSWLLNCW